MNIIYNLIRVFSWSPVETILYFWINLLNLVKRYWLELQTNCENWTNRYFGINGNGTFVLMYQILCDDKAQTNSIGVSSWSFLDKSKESKKSINISLIHSHPSVFYLYLKKLWFLVDNNINASSICKFNCIRQQVCNHLHYSLLIMINF